MAGNKKAKQPLDPAVQMIELEKRILAVENAIFCLKEGLSMVFPLRVQVVRTGQILTVGSVSDLPKDGSWRLLEGNVRPDGSLR